MIIAFVAIGVFIVFFIYCCIVVGARADKQINFLYSNICEHCNKEFIWGDEDSIGYFLNLDGSETHIIKCPHCKRKTRVRR